MRKSVAFSIPSILLTLSIALSGASLGHAANAADGGASLSVQDLVDEGRMPTAVDVTVEHDLVYDKEMRYRGYPLREVLEAIPNIGNLLDEGAEVTFTADDGYVATMALDDALAGDGIIAFRDLNAPAGHDWQTFLQGKQTMSPAPFYVVWPDQDPSNASFKWPYQLATIAVASFSKIFGDAVPKGGGPRVREGFTVFKTYCLSCHSINLTGGELAPELNVPRSITEYWARDVLRDFIHDVSNYRAGSKMQSFAGILEPEEIDTILDYLTYMASQKVCADAAACEAMLE